jgi:CubicO group peptidase (beta-lactamase class C family)
MGTRWWPATVALSVVVVCTGSAACTTSSVGPSSTTAATAAAGAATPAVCSASDAALADAGATIWQGISDEFTNSPKDQFHDARAVLISVCGRPVVTQYLGGAKPEDYHTIASVTKSITSTLVGIALSEGALKSLDQTLGELLPGRHPDMAPAVAALSLRQLLTMSSGLDADGANGAVSDWSTSTDFVGGILRLGITGHVGQFAYSTATSHVLAAVLRQATGRPLLEYAREKLFDPLDIPTQPAEQPLLAESSMAGYDGSGFSWPVDHQGVNFGGGWLRLRPADLLKLGQLYLDGGRYHGRQVVPAQWVRDATARQVDTNGGFGGPAYGYQWWVTTAGKEAEPAYAAIGYGGQIIEVVPSRRLVAAFVTEVLTTTAYEKVDGKSYEDVVSYLVVPHLGS